MTQDDVFRIAAFSGMSADRSDALLRQSQTSGCSVLFGDYLAELNLAWHTLELNKDPNAGYDKFFLEHLLVAASSIAERKQKVVTDAGAMNPKGLAEIASKKLAEMGLDLKVAYVEGDSVLGRLEELAEKGETFNHLEGGDRPLSGWNLKPMAANAYVGARGIRAALEAGADIVISGRCTDASPVIGAAAWYHNWDWNNFDALAGALLAGHCIECGAYVTGGNSSGFKAYKDTFYNFAMGIAEISRDGTFVVTKQPNSNGFNGVVNDVTVRSQILYEIQGNVYLNPDVQALIDDIVVTEIGHDRVRVTGVTGVAPPETTKLAICAIAGWQAETMIFATGLDVTEKFDTYRMQTKIALGKDLARFTTFDMTQYGVPAENPKSEAQATAMMRIFAQSPDKAAFGPHQNLAILTNPDGLGHFPGCCWHFERRAAVPTPYIEYWPATVRQKHLPLKVTMVGGESRTISAVGDEAAPVVKQSDYDAPAFDAAQWGPTKRGPIGHVVHARSGDKGGNANVGFFARSADEYTWLRSLLSKKQIISMLEDEFTNNRIERVEFPGMKAVHFVIHDYLGKGVSSTARLDNLAKSVAEYLRSKYVDLPEQFVQRGII